MSDPSAQPPAAQTARSRGLGALYGLAIGDALGMPTQNLSREEILTDYGRIEDFLPAGPRQLIAAGQAAGTVTDDTEQMLLVAEMLVRQGTVDARAFAAALAAWEDRVRARGSTDLLGPSTTAALELLRQGAGPEESGRNGTTNGAAMRVAPVGVALPAWPLDRLVDAVVETSAVTHNTSLGIASAAAVAAAVSAGVEGATRAEAVAHAVRTAEQGALRGHRSPGPSIAARIRWAIEYLPTQADLSRAVYEVVGTTVASQESVVAALAIAATVPDPWDAVCRAAGAGGDTDTVAAIVGAVVGACDGIEAFPPTAVATVRRVNDLHLEPLVDALLLRRGRAAPSPVGAPS